MQDTMLLTVQDEPGPLDRATGNDSFEAKNPDP